MEIFVCLRGKIRSKLGRILTFRLAPLLSGAPPDESGVAMKTGLAGLPPARGVRR